MTLAGRIRDLRLNHDLTLEQLAGRSGISRTYLWELEHDTEGLKKPSAGLLDKIAKALSVSLTELMGLPSVRVEGELLGLSPSLVEFRDRMATLGQPLTDDDVRDLSSMRFRGSSPSTVDAWHALYFVFQNPGKRW